MDTSPLDSSTDPAALLAEAEAELAAINDALRRLDDGTYGRCLQCGATIADAVLELDPLATTCQPSCSG